MLLGIRQHRERGSCLFCVLLGMGERAGERGLRLGPGLPSKRGKGVAASFGRSGILVSVFFLVFDEALADLHCIESSLVDLGRPLISSLCVCAHQKSRISLINGCLLLTVQKKAGWLVAPSPSSLV